jgi:hypothetical protein
MKRAQRISAHLWHRLRLETSFISKPINPYIKANQPGSWNIRVQGVGIVTKSLMGCMTSGEFQSSSISDLESLFARVAWVHKEEFSVTIPAEEGKLTNIRAATIYEEYLPVVQESILAKISSA